MAAAHCCSSDSESPAFSLEPNSAFLSDESETSGLESIRKWSKGFKPKDSWSSKKKKQVFLEGYVEASEEHVQDHKGSTRTKSLTDDDLDELKGCLDLGFGFSYQEIPDLCNTLPALELCYSMSQRFLDEHHKSPEASSGTTGVDSCSTNSSPIANWKISSPGDHPEEVKARLKFWAQAVACTVRLCS